MLTNVRTPIGFVLHCPRGLPRVTLPKLFDWYSEDFGGKEKVMLWLLGVLPEEQREALRGHIEAEYDSPVLGLDDLTEGRRRDSIESDVSTDSRLTMVCHLTCPFAFRLTLHLTIYAVLV
eukprot:COSAG02_NODE_12348_length_1559_cov_1.910959_2_plen_120_part_00